MQVRKLFQALVLGGVALVGAGCGGGADGTQPPSPQVNTADDGGTLPDGGTLLPDGGTPDGGDTGGGGGPLSW